MSKRICMVLVILASIVFGWWLLSGKDNITITNNVELIDGMQYQLYSSVRYNNNDNSECVELAETSLHYLIVLILSRLDQSINMPEDKFFLDGVNQILESSNCVNTRLISFDVVKELRV